MEQNYTKSDQEKIGCYDAADGQAKLIAWSLPGCCLIIFLGQSGENDVNKPQKNFRQQPEKVGGFWNQLS